MTSTIKVNTVKDTASTDIIKKCGTSITVGTASDTTTVAGNAVRSNAIQASDGQNIISQVGATITLGATGDNIVLAGGATQSGFGRTGTVDWNTTPKTATFTAVSGEGYFANTSGSAFNMNLPAGVAGAIVSVADYAATWQTNALTVVPNGTDKIGGVNANVGLSVEGQSVTFIFVDSTQGWVNTMDSTSNVRASEFFTATVSGSGNTLVTAPCCANVKIATFTGPGNFNVASLSATAPENVISYMAVAGGGGGAARAAGGGGGGGFREGKSPVTGPYSVSPLNAPTGLTISATGSYPVVVGGGGAGGGPPAGETPGVQGGTSSFSTISSAGGGRGQGSPGGPGANGNGGSGGGAGPTNNGGSGNTPPVSPPQGNNGGTGAISYNGAGGGGAGGVGANSSPSGGGAGGAVITTSISALPTAYAGGGGGSSYFTPNQGPGGAGTPTSGAGGPGTSTTGAKGGNGVVNTGGAGGAGSTGPANPACGCGGNGGSGIVIIRYKFQ